MIEKLKDTIIRTFESKVFPCAVSSVVVICSLGLIYSSTGSRSLLPALIALAVFAAFNLIFLYASSHSKAGRLALEAEAFLGSMTNDLIVKMSTPVLICNADGEIVWGNSEFSSLVEKRSLSRVKFEEFAGIHVSDIKNDSSGTVIEYNGRIFSVRCYPVSSKSKPYYITLWDDRTEFEKTVSSMKNEEIMVAYVMADNLEELSQYAKESTKEAANELEKLLAEWAESVDGVLKEYQSGRFLFLFRSAELENFLEKKFDILDKIREIRVGESSLSVTVSMGVSQISGSIADKERVASEALDMALQRGGDQAVVKSAKGLEFFGGKMQTVQKRSKVRARVIATELASLISKSTNVIIMGHRAADFDCIGACLGIARLASFCGVPFNIVCNGKDPNFIRCHERIKDLEIYKDETVFVNSAEAQELIGSEALTVIVDVNNKLQLEAPAVAEMSHRTVYIDHHRKTAEFDEPPLISYIEPSASSACELVSEILEQALPSGMLIKEEADIMYSGILLDTKQFTRNAGVKTFGAALFLRGEGANPADAQTLFKSCLDDFISEAKFESNVKIYRRHMAISYNDDPENGPSDRIAAAKAADKLLTVEGVKASFALCRIGDTVHVSARSGGEVNVQLILEKLEGGGHFDSAATQLPGSVEEVLSRLKGAIDEYIEENNT